MNENATHNSSFFFFFFKKIEMRVILSQFSVSDCVRASVCTVHYHEVCEVRRSSNFQQQQPQQHKVHSSPRKQILITDILRSQNQIASHEIIFSLSLHAFLIVLLPSPSLAPLSLSWCLFSTATRFG